MTLIDFYRKVLEKLQVAAAGEDMQPEDVQLVEDKYAAVYDMLLTRDLVAWSASGDLPDYAVLPLTNMVAWAAAGEFGADQNAYALEGSIDLPQESLAERQLRRQLARSYVSKPAVSEYF